MTRRRRYTRFIERYEQRSLERRERPPHPVRRLALVVVALTVILIGVALLVLPGPGWLVLLAGLFILAGEFRWVAVTLDRSEEIAAPRAERVWRFLRRRPASEEE